MGYTLLDTTSAHGAIERSKRQECQLADQAKRNVTRGALTTFAELRLTTGPVTVSASANAGGPTGNFSAEAHEERDGMTIVRESRGVSAPGDFEADHELTWRERLPAPTVSG